MDYNHTVQQCLHIVFLPYQVHAGAQGLRYGPDQLGNIQPSSFQQFHNPMYVPHPIYGVHPVQFQCHPNGFMQGRLPQQRQNNQRTTTLGGNHPSVGPTLYQQYGVQGGTQLPHHPQPFLPDLNSGRNLAFSRDTRCDNLPAVRDTRSNDEHKTASTENPSTPCKTLENANGMRRSESTSSIRVRDSSPTNHMPPGVEDRLPRCHTLDQESELDSIAPEVQCTKREEASSKIKNGNPNNTCKSRF